MMGMLLFLSIFLISFAASAALPLYEFGVAAGGGYIPDYPASDQAHLKYIALPIFIYRGDIFKTGKNGSRALIYKSPKLNFDLSTGAAFPSSSTDNKAREGMDDLDWLMELGPRINYNLLKTDSIEVELEFPLRFVLSTDFSFTKQRGYRFYPQIDFRKKINDKLKINLSFKWNWGSESLNDYFYEVTKKDVLTNRARYNAKEGYIGSSLSSFATYYNTHSAYIVGLKYSNFSQSANANGPLYKSKENTAIFLAWNYFFYQSKEFAKD